MKIFKITQKNKAFPIVASTIAISLALSPNLSNAVPVNAPLRAEAAVQKLNLTQKNKDFKFSKQEKKNGAVIFYNVKTSEGLTADKMIIDNQEESGRIRITMEGVAVSEDEMAISTDKFIMVFNELPDGSSTNDILNPNNIDKVHLNGDISAENFTVDTGSMPIKLGKFSLNGLDTQKNNVKFKDLHVRDFDADAVVARVKMKELDIAGINDALFSVMNSSGKNIDKEWDNIGLELFRIAGVEVTSEALGKPNKEGGNSFDGLKLANFEISGLEKNVLKHFVFNGFETGGSADGSPINIKIGEFGFDNLNLLYFKTIIQSLEGNKNQEIGEKSLADIAPYGPYGILMTKARFADILVAVDGIKFTLDDMSYLPTFNAQNVITAIKMPKTTLEVGVTDKSRKTAAEFSEFLSEFGLKSLKFSAVGDGNYDPVTGIASNGNNQFSLENVGDISSNGTIGGLNDFMKNTKVKDLVDYSKSLEGDLQDSEGKTDGKKIVETQIKAIDKGMSLYKDMTIINFNISMKEYGFLNRLALSEAASKGKTAKAIRKDWAKRFIDASKDKKNSPMGRDFAASFGQFVEKGGSISFSFKPTQPVKVTRLFEKDITSKETGLVIATSN